MQDAVFLCRDTAGKAKPGVSLTTPVLVSALAAGSRRSFRSQLLLCSSLLAGVSHGVACTAYLQATTPTSSILPETSTAVAAIPARRASAPEILAVIPGRVKVDAFHVLAFDGCLAGDGELFIKMLLPTTLNETGFATVTGTENGAVLSNSLASCVLRMCRCAMFGIRI